MKNYIILLFMLSSLFSFSQTTIFDIARKGDSKTMDAFIMEHPSLINTKNDSGFTALILASYAGNESAVSSLLKNGANLNVLSNMGTALTAAVYKNNEKIISLLLQNGADVNLADTRGRTPLHYACSFNNIKTVRLLLSKKANKNKKNTQGQTPLDLALVRNNIELIKLLK